VIIDPASGWLVGVRRVVSPNCDERPDERDVTLIVVHGISLPPGRFGGAWIDRLFLNDLPRGADPYFATIQELKVSAHVLIDRRGAPTQYVPFTHRAWHAGKSEYDGRAACNDFSIGIELEGTDELPYTPAQYQSLVRLIRSLRDAYPRVSDAAIVGHSDVSPGRKTDPGPSFDWPHLRRLIAAD
jgi:AmpD protein